MKWHEKALGFAREEARQLAWLVGVSGGADSVALLRLLVEHGFSKLIVCHLDHGLREEAGREDASFVGHLAAELGLPCELGVADVRARMKDKNESLETAARQARHAFFAHCTRKFACQKLLLAHHAEDQAETVLWNLMRGSHGLKGMLPEQSITTECGALLEIHRPLLEVRKYELIAWLDAYHHPWREDASNQQPIAIRNRLRHEVLPLLAAITSRDPVAALARGARATRENEQWMRWSMAQTNVRDPQGRLHVRALSLLPLALQRAFIADYLAAAGISQTDHALLESAVSLVTSSSPPCVNLPGGARLRRRAARMWVEQPDSHGGSHA